MIEKAQTDNERLTIGNLLYLLGLILLLAAILISLIRCSNNPLIIG